MLKRGNIKLSENANNLLFLIKENQNTFYSDNFDIDAKTASKKRKIDEYFDELIINKCIKEYKKEVIYDNYERPIKIVYHIER